MATIVADIIEGARWKETGGTVIKITRMFIVHDLPAPPGAIPGVAFAVQQSFDEIHRTALNNLGVPQAGEVHPVEGHLVVTTRTPRALSPFAVAISIDYELPGGGSFDPPPGDSFVLSGASSVEQIETVWDRPSNSPGMREQVFVEHNGVTQYGTISPFEARDVLRIGGILPSVNPWVMSRFWTNTVNDGNFTWDGAADPRTWLVTEIAFELVDRNAIPPKYNFNVSLRHNPDKWDPAIWFTDDDGRPAENLVPLMGYKIIPWHVALTFNSSFFA